MDTNLNRTLLTQTLGFHGLPLIKTWNEENGSNSLKQLGIQSNDIDTTVYHKRQQNLNITDHSKRLRLHQFICNKANLLFKNHHEDPSARRNRKSVATGGDTIPPLEFFTRIDKDVRMKRFFDNIKIGDIAYCTVSVTGKFGLLLKVLCTTGSASRLVSDLNVKGVVATQNLATALDAKNVVHQLLPNDYVCCEVLNISDHPQLNLGMRGINKNINGPSLGLISSYQLPAFYKTAIDPHYQDKSYNEILKETEQFKNPAIIDNLLIESGLHPETFYTNMSKNKYPQDEYAKDLLQAQASKKAFRSVAEGIEFFKNGKHTEAFQCLNHALTIDPRNVEGLVARGALYANSGTFNKAIVDFEAALKLNGNHANAKKYLGETLLALGREYEEKNNIEEAVKAYMDCLKVNPHHPEALASLEKTRLNTKKIVEPSELELPNIASIPLLKALKSSRDYPDALKDDVRKEKKSKKDKKRKGKKRHNSSSESSSDSSESSDSSDSSSESSDQSSDSDSNRRKDRKRQDKSLSPLSKRMDLAENSYQFNQNFGVIDDHELKVKEFLEMGRDEEDYEEKVRQYVAEASKYQKSKEEQSRKKKRKSEKKLKKEKKKRKKDEKSKKSKGNEIENLREALKMFESLPEFSKFKKMCDDKIKEEEAKTKQTEQQNDDEFAPGKWRMKFAKDERQTDPKQKSSAKQQFGFGYESEEEDPARNFQGHALTQLINYNAPSTSTYDKNKKQRSPERAKPKQEVPPVPAVPIVSKGAVVLDKFGNFRLADPVALPKLPESSRRSRSKSRRRDSRSRSDSRSPRYRRRYSRSASKSYSRSRSRSPRSRHNRNFRGGRSGFTDRYKRYSPVRQSGRGGARGRWNDNYRDSRDFRGRPSDRYSRERPRSSVRGRRSYGRHGRSKSRSASEERSSANNRDRSPGKYRDEYGKPDEPSLAEMEAMLDKSRKEKKDDIIDRSKDIVKKW